MPLVFGDRAVLDAAADLCGLPRLGQATVVPIGIEGSERISVVPGRPSVIAGKMQVAALEKAVDAALSGSIGGVVTAPLSKEWAARAGFAFPGHTEYLAMRAGNVEHAMMLAGPRLRVTPATTHVALSEVPRVLSAEAIASAIFLTAETLRFGFGIESPRVAVAALNPHAGESGLFGDEETRLIVPGIERALERLRADVRFKDARQGMARDGVASDASVANPSVWVSGPHVPDVVFRQAAMGDFDAVVAMYHDQGLIPLKLLDFDDGVNVTLGLPFVRTSPDHGTAYDLAGTGRARHQSFRAALDLASLFIEKSRVQR